MFHGSTVLIVDEQQFNEQLPTIHTLQHTGAFLKQKTTYKKHNYPNPRPETRHGNLEKVLQQFPTSRVILTVSRLTSVISRGQNAGAWLVFRSKRNIKIAGLVQFISMFLV